MLGCYAIFFTAMAALASGTRHGLFMVTISILYVVIFFGTSTLLAKLPGIRDESPLDRGKALPTWCGPMSRGAVYGQVLIVPVGIAIFGVEAALISALTG